MKLSMYQLKLQPRTPNNNNNSNNKQQLRINNCKKGSETFYPKTTSAAIKSTLIKTNCYDNLTKPLIFYSLILMSLFYQVMSSTKCPKIKKHAGIKLMPARKGKDPYSPGEVVIFKCESNELQQSIKCLDTGKWNEMPFCPDPTNFTCPNLEPITHGTYNVSGPYKVGSVVSFKCDNEIYNATNSNQQQPQNSTTNATFDALSRLSAGADETVQSQQQQPLRYNLTGYRNLRCLPSAKWNHPQPTCLPVATEPTSNLSFLLISLFLIIPPILILIGIVQLVARWRKRQQQRERWKQYFTDYKYRHSKTSIKFGMRPNNPNTTIPVTDL